jgi:hypothetical protein
MIAVPVTLRRPGTESDPEPEFSRRRHPFGKRSLNSGYPSSNSVFTCPHSRPSLVEELADTVGPDTDKGAGRLSLYTGRRCDVAPGRSPPRPSILVPEGAQLSFDPQGPVFPIGGGGTQW